MRREETIDGVKNATVVLVVIIVVQYMCLNVYCQMFEKSKLSGWEMDPTI